MSTAPDNAKKSNVSVDIKDENGFIGENSEVQYSVEQAELLSQFSVESIQNAFDYYNSIDTDIPVNVLGISRNSDFYKKLESAGLTNPNGTIKGFALIDERSRRKSNSRSENISADNITGRDGAYVSGYNREITVNMSESERAEILRNKSVTPVEVGSEQSENFDFNELKNNIKSKVEKALLKKFRELGFLKKYSSSAIGDIEFEFTAGGVRKSLNSQENLYGGTKADFAKAVVHLQELLDNAVLIETHTDKGKGTNRENPQLKQVYVLLSVMRDGDNVIPVQFEVKQYVDDNNRLYLAVALTKVETGVMGNTIHGENHASTSLLPVSNISIPELFAKINPEDRNFLKYIPDEFLNDEQLQAKKRALDEDKVKYNGNDDENSGSGGNASSDVEQDAEVETKHFTKDQYDEAKEYRDGFVKSESADSSESASIMPENESVLPNVSAADGETDSYEAFTKRYNGTLELTEDQRTIQSICTALGTEAVFKNLDRWVTGKDGKRRFFSPDGYFDKATGKIYINTSTNGKHNPLLFVIKHELTHFGEINKNAYDSFVKAVKESKEFKAWLEHKTGMKGETVDIMAAKLGADIRDERSKYGVDVGVAESEQEVIANFAGDILFAKSGKTLDSLLNSVEAKQKPKVIQLVADFFRWLREKLSGNKDLTFQLQRLESKYTAMLKSTQKSSENTNSTGEGGKEYLIAHDETFARYCDVIDQIEVNDDISQKGQYVEVSQQTPSIIVEKANAKDLPMAILFDTAYLETRHDGKIFGNYHNLGADNMKNLPKLLETPEYIIKLTNGRLNVVVDMGTSKGKQTLVSIELDQSKQVNGKFNQYNLIITAFSAKSGYLDKIVNNPDNEVLYNKKTESQGTDQLHKGLDGINDSAFNNTVPQKEQSVNSNSTQETRELLKYYFCFVCLVCYPSKTECNHTAGVDVILSKKGM